MADSTSAVVVKADGTVVPSTFFEDNADGLRLAIKLTDITEIAWVASKGGLVVTTADGDVFVPCFQVPS